MNNYKNRIKLNLRKYAGELLQDPNIIAVGLGNKIINGNQLDIPTFTVIVEEKLNESEVNPYTRIPKEVNGILTDVIECKNPLNSDIQYGPIVPQAAASLPVYGGSYIKNAKNKSIIGCLAHVMYDVDNNIYLLSTVDVLTKDENMSYNPDNPESIIYPANPEALKDFFPPSPFKPNEPVELASKMIITTKPILDLDPTDTDNFNVLNAGLAFVGNISNPMVAKKISPGVQPRKQVLKKIKVVKVKDKIFKYSPIVGEVPGVILATDAYTAVEIYSKKYLYRDQIIASMDYQKGDQGTLGLIKSKSITANADSTFGMCIGGSTKNKMTIFTPMVEITSKYKVGIVELLNPY